MTAAAEVRLTEWTACGGCAAKWGGAALRELVAGLAADAPASLVLGLAPADDAAVYRLTDELALVSTTDFFPPLVDDPDDFGTIAAANACSDVFAMGGEVRLALNVAAFPEDLPAAAIAVVLEAAARAVREAGGVVAGGHTIRNPEPVFGLAVQGVVHPDRAWAKATARPGDVLVLSKPLGTGLVLAAGEPADVATAIASMRRLNRSAAADLHQVTGGPSACTDVTGFGLAGHGWEVAERSAVVVEVVVAALPRLPGADRAAADGVRTGGDGRNRELAGAHVELGPGITAADEALVFDPQTSGGLLAAVAPGDAARLVRRGWAEVGRVVAGDPAVRLT